VQDFLAKCFYHSGSSYGDENAYMEMMGHIQSYEHLTVSSACNRLFYLAIPPNVFGETGVTIKKVAMSVTGWTRVVIEKPFGRDLKSCQDLLEQLAGQFDEGHLYRIDHYLGKEVVQNLSLFRFGNSWLEWLWHRDAIQSVLLTFKEPFGTEGRGGYFDHYGIIRDILQNHLLQVLTLVAMEPPADHSGDSMRDAKTNVLKAIQPIDLEKDVRLGQYDGYADDETIKNKDTNCPTYAAIRCWIDTPRWKGVPFIMQAGKAMDDGVCEVRIRFRAPSSTIHTIRPPSRQALETNELVMRLQPNPVLEMKTNIKTPGLSGIPMPAKLSLSYNELIEGPDAVGNNPDAYTRLLLDVLRGRNGSFVRDDELHRSWEIFTPLLHLIEQENVRPESYQYGSEGPSGIAKWLEEKMLESSNTTALPQAAL
jgi:glucose-6-phosphate 1-dehydrogenase